MESIGAASSSQSWHAVANKLLYTVRLDDSIDLLPKRAPRELWLLGAHAEPTSASWLLADDRPARSYN